MHKLIAALVTLSALVCGTASAEPTLTLEPDNSSLRVGQVVDVRIVVDDIADLYGWQFDLSFDSSQLAFGEAREGGFLAAAGPTFFFSGEVSSDATTVEGVASVLSGAGPGVSGSGTLVDLSFTALTQGVSALGLVNVVLLNSNLQELAFATSLVTITVTAVPEPLSTSLVLLGLGFLFRNELARQMKFGLGLGRHLCLS